MEHYELVQEMGSVERLTTQERLKHARKRRQNQLKKYTQYERHLEKESTKKKKHHDKQPARPKKGKGNIRFAPNIALLESAARNDLNEVKRLLESGVSPNVTNEDGLTALHQCCIDDSEAMMKLLLDYNANVNACDSEKWTPLHAAATCGHMNLCKQLIDRGAELLAVNADGNMPYDICEDEVTLDHIETEMSKRGITQEQIDVTRLATEHQMLEDVKDFASQGGDLETLDHIGATMLHIAAANGYIEVAEFLLDNHVSVDARDNESWQPVHAAAYWAQQEIMEMLVENGADLDSKTKNGETPFDLCEEPDLKQKILDMKDEIETNRSIRQQRLGSQRKHRVSSRNLGQSSDSLYSSNSSLNRKTSVSASMRRSSMRGDKSQLFKKERKEEALHFSLNLMHDEELLTEADEEHESVPSTDLDAVAIVVTHEDDKQQPAPLTMPVHDAVDGSSLSDPSPPTITVTTNTPTPLPRHQGSGDSLTPRDAHRPALQPSPPGLRGEPLPQQHRPPHDPSHNSSSPRDPRPHDSTHNSSSPRDPRPHDSTHNSSSLRDPQPQPQQPRPVHNPCHNSSNPRDPRPHDTTHNTSSLRDPRPQAPANKSSNPRDPRPQGPSHNSSNPRDPSLRPQPLPRQAGPGNERTQPNSTLSDLKKHRSNSRENLLDAAVQDMFLESVQVGRRRRNSAPKRGPASAPAPAPPPTTTPLPLNPKLKNGHNNNNSSAMRSSTSDGQLRRFVAPRDSPMVGGEDGKQKCCVIL